MIKKNIYYCIGEFNIDLLKFNSSEHINKFLNDSSSYYLYPQILLPAWISDNSQLSLIICSPILLKHLLKMLPQVILLLVYLITFQSFSFCRISFLIIKAKRKMLKYMSGADLIRINF